MRTTLAKQITRWEKRLAAQPEAEGEFNVIYVYEDGLTWKWAREVSEQVGRLVAPAELRSTWWKIEDLNYPGVLAGAVSMAVRADLLVVALHSGEGQPLPFYIWVNSWWPHRKPDGGALVALLSAPERPNRQSGRMRKYLRALARHARLEFILEERTGSSDKKRECAAAREDAARRAA